MQITRCFDIGGTKIVAADVNIEGKSVERARFATPIHSYTDFVHSLKSNCPGDAAPIGISIAGVIQPDTGLVNSVNIPCLSGKCLASELSQLLNRSVYIINDANAFALAEATFGEARDHEVVLGIILGTGVGGGIVINGRVLEGIGGTTGEWGHGPASAIRTGAVLPQTRCQCGQMQCIDALGSARGLETLYAHINSTQLGAEQVINAWENGDAKATQAIDVWLDIVGGALASAVNFLAPSIVVVGGGLANAKNLMLQLDKEVGARRLAAHTKPLLHTAISGPEQGLLGAAIYCHGQTSQ